MKLLGILAVVVSLGLGGLALGCSSPPEGPPPQRAFYYWRTTFRLSPSERRALTEQHVARIYLRVFDIAWSEPDHQAMPLGAITAVDPVPPGIEIVPVVFVREDVLKRTPPGDLAVRIWGEVERRAKLVGFAPRELQIDCDWTDRSKAAFFELLQALRATSHLPLSATIRLHQIKYRERTGVPPSERGMLMFYNMGKFSADPDARSIFDAESAAKYLARIRDYPLPLDVALPIWSWTVHVQDHVVIGLMQSTDPAELDGLDFLEATPEGYVVTRSTFLHGTFLRAGDVLKVEVTGPAETLAAAAMVAAHLAPALRSVALFDLSERNLTRHDQASLDRVYRTVR